MLTSLIVSSEIRQNPNAGNNRIAHKSSNVISNNKKNTKYSVAK